MRRLAWGGAIGPIAFVSAWVVGGLVTDRNYSPVDDTISRLAAVGAETRPLMTAGFVAFGLAVPAYAAALRRAIPGPAWIAAAATGVSTLFVAALPVDRSSLVDALHAAAAGTGYLTLVAVPLLAARPLRRLGHSTLASFGVGLAAVSTLSLATSLAVDATGLFQRIGLTATDAWLVASVPAVHALVRRSGD